MYCRAFHPCGGNRNRCGPLSHGAGGGLPPWDGTAGDAGLRGLPNPAHLACGLPLYLPGQAAAGVETVPARWPGSLIVSGPHFPRSGSLPPCKCGWHAINWFCTGASDPLLTSAGNRVPLGKVLLGYASLHLPTNSSCPSCSSWLRTVLGCRHCRPVIRPFRGRRLSILWQNSA